MGSRKLADVKRGRGKLKLKAGKTHNGREELMIPLEGFIRNQ